MSDRRRWFLTALVILALIAVADLHLNGGTVFMRFAEGFSVVAGQQVPVR